MQRQAALWDEQGRSSGLLLRDAALAEAEAWVAAHEDELEPHERDFLDSCRQARAAAKCERWDYYAIFTPKRFFSATIADLGYAGNIFVYSIDFTSGDLHEEGAVIPLGRGIQLPRDSTSGVTSFENKQMSLRFQADAGERRVFVDWPGFHEGQRG